MIVRIIQTHKNNGKWFYADQEYLLVDTITGSNPDCFDTCDPNAIDYGKYSGLYYKVTIDTQDYYIPEATAAIIPGDTPSTNMDPHLKRINDWYTRDPVASLTGDRTDVVKQAKMIYGIDIRSNVSNIQVDMVRYNELRQRMEEKGYLFDNANGMNDVSQ